MVFNNEYYYKIEQQIEKYVIQCPRKYKLNEILELRPVEIILENSLGEVTKEARQVYHHIRIAFENKRYLYPVVTAYLIRKLPEEYFFKKILGVNETLFDVIMKHSFELPIHRRVHTHFSFLFECDVDSVIYEMFRKLQGRNEKIRNSVFFHKVVLKCPLNQCIKNWKFLHVLIKMYKPSFNEEWKKQYKRVVNKIVPASFKDIAFIQNFEEIDESDYDSDPDSDYEPESDDCETVCDSDCEYDVLPLPLLVPNGFERVSMRGDGNCLFNCISYYLYNTQERHMHVRNSCLDYIRTHIDEFNVDPNLDIEQYTRNRAWGDGIIMSAICKHFRVNVKVYLEQQMRFIDAAHVPGYENNTVYLYYTGDHFDILKKSNYVNNELSICLIDTFQWNVLYDYLNHFEEHIAILGSGNVCSHMVNYNMYNILLNLFNMVQRHAVDDDNNRREQCMEVLRRIEQKLQAPPPVVV